MRVLESRHSSENQNLRLNTQNTGPGPRGPADTAKSLTPAVSGCFCINEKTSREDTRHNVVTNARGCDVNRCIASTGRAYGFALTTLQLA